ncbi:MAG: hypothetical protein GY820_10235 [Gammaproteobacteria bacterium]|nr:hypothetical protein [Gammaproteobacteria bacterium]
MEEVTRAMSRFGDAVHLDTLYRALATHPKARRNPNRAYPLYTHTHHI